MYDKVFKNSLDELEDLDFLLSLKEKGFNEKQKDILLDREYSDILLIFDYEPQDHRFDVEKISTMMRCFSESTDNGKLYINYPSIDSYRHIHALPDINYLSRFYKLQELVNDGKSQYKAIVSRESVIPDIRRYTKDVFNYLITENIRKAEYIENTSISLDLLNSYATIDESHLLSIINQRFLKENIVPVLNTSLFFICEYNIQLIF